jgi:hypothetical protein
MFRSRTCDANPAQHKETSQPKPRASRAIIEGNKRGKENRSSVRAPLQLRGLHLSWVRQVVSFETKPWGPKTSGRAPARIEQKNLQCCSLWVISARTSPEPSPDTFSGPIAPSQTKGSEQAKKQVISAVDKLVRERCGFGGGTGGKRGEAAAPRDDVLRRVRVMCLQLLEVLRTPRSCKNMILFFPSHRDSEATDKAKHSFYGVYPGTPAKNRWSLPRSRSPSLPCFTDGFANARVMTPSDKTRIIGRIPDGPKGQKTTN